ncbi:hypothetical protein B6D60_10090 [candidate division KSB1 bacterium 4484_87]|nr:MAG: hypothetical protein B6D60_10090 [candidate division KSB1 bacterium 4484_87]
MQKWIGWDKSKYVLLLGFLLIGSYILYIALFKANLGPCFRFQNATVENWTLDQLYDTNSKPYAKITTFIPGAPPTYKTYTPFSLANFSNLGIAATTSLYLVSGSKVKSADIYLQSPDLSKDKNFQGIVGFSVDVRREFFSPCGDPANSFFAQLQLKIIQKATKTEHLLFEKNKTGGFVFHEIKLATPYPLRWEWGKTIILNDKTILKQKDYLVKQLRIRFTMPGYISNGECYYRGSWKIGNVCVTK